jgi:hypothetical protein
MIIDKSTDALELDGDTSGIITAGIDVENYHIIMSMTAEDLYKNPLGSFIREIVSNCFDANVESGSEDAIMLTIEFDAENSRYFICFKDSGIGISPDRMNTVYKNWFSSTKRKTNKQIGGFGLGSKSPLAYTNEFYLITVNEGIEYTYLVLKNYPLNIIDPISKKATTAKNGTTVKVPLKSGDHYNAELEIKQQCAYFDNLYVCIHGINNDYRIIRGKHFVYRQDSPFQQTHILLGKVAYPLDFNQVFGSYSHNYKWSSIPIAVKFEVGELEVTLSREELKYTNDAIKTLIRTRVEQAIQEILSLHSAQIESVSTIKEFIEITNSKSVLNFTDSISVAIPKELAAPPRFQELPDVNFHLSTINNLFYCRDIEQNGKVQGYNSDGISFSSRYTSYIVPSNYTISAYAGNIHPSSRIYKMTKFDKVFLRRFLEDNVGKYGYKRTGLSKKVLPINGGVRRALEAYKFLKANMESMCNTFDYEAIEEIKKTKEQERLIAARQAAAFKKERLLFYKYEYGTRSSPIEMTVEQVQKRYILVMYAEIGTYKKTIQDYYKLLKVGGRFPVDKILICECSKQVIAKLVKMDNTVHLDHFFDLPQFDNLFRYIRVSDKIAVYPAYIKIQGLPYLCLKHLSTYYYSIFKKLENIKDTYKYDGALKEKVLSTVIARKLYFPDMAIYAKELDKLAPHIELISHMNSVYNVPKEHLYRIFNLLVKTTKLNKQVYEQSKRAIKA